MSLCGKVFKDFSNPCVLSVTGFKQLGVLINLDDIDDKTINLPDFETGDCDYTIEFDLKCETKGFKIQAIDAGSAIKGYVDKTRNENGYPQYTHHVDVILSGLDKDVNCFLASLDSGRYGIALMTNDGTVVTYGMQNGLTSDDYTYDIVEGGGSVVITLSSLENAPESTLPLIYKAGSGSTEVLDFESAFAGTTPCP